MNQLTEKQQYTLETIAQFIGQRGISPTFAELRTKLGISSNQSLIDRIVLLEQKELVVRNPKQHRSISLGPKATEYFRSLRDYTPSPMPSVTYSQLPGTFDNKLSVAVGFVDSGSFVEGTTTTVTPFQVQ
jgi:SOS-response transcriptional repressor LexA